MISVAEAKTIRRFGQNAFNDNEKITTLDDLDKFENGYIYHSGAFSGMPNLVTASTGLKINLTSGLPDTFTMNYKNCPKLERIKINKHITTISNTAFENDVSLKTIIWGGNETTIGQAAFKGSGIEEIKFPKGIIGLTYETFRNCTSLRKIELSEMTSLGATVFAGCTALNMDIDMPLLEGELNQTFSSSGITRASFGKITKISNFALGSCPNLKYVILPETMTTIGTASFYGSTALEYIVCHATTPPTLDYSAFNGGVSCLIYVPDASVSNYKSATNWSKIASRIKPLSEKP